jgi:hypothetical protein
MLGIHLDGPSWMFGNNASVITSAAIPHCTFIKGLNSLSYHFVRKFIAAEILYLLNCLEK